MARPSLLPYWATNDETDPIYNTANKSIPTTQKQDYGQRGNQNTFRQDINYLFNNIRSWLEFFNDQYALGTVYSTSDLTKTEAQISNQLGGTWQFIDGSNNDGQTTLAGVDVVLFIKISEVNI